MTALMIIMDLCMIVQSFTTAISAVQQLSSLPTDKFHTNNENNVTFCDATDNGKAICNSKRNYAPVTNSSKAGVIQQFTLQKLC